MHNVVLNDKATISTKVTDARGFLRVSAVFSKVGIQRYTAKELGLQGRPPGDILRIFRPPEEVFAQDSLDSFENAPVTDDHPSENVTASNSRKYVIGTAVGKRQKLDDEHTGGEILIQDAEAIAKIDNGKVELSDGYSCEIVLMPGLWKGQAYDGFKKNIRGNHIALVGAGRCGGACRLLDAEMCEECSSGAKEAPYNCHGGENDMSTGGQASPQLVPRVVDGITVEVTTQGAQVIDKLQAQLADAKTKAETAETALAAANTAHTAALEAKDGEIAGLTAQLSDDALDQRATERGDLIATVGKIMGADYQPTGKTNVQLMRDALTKVYGAEAVKDRSDDYLKGQFATIKAQASKGDDSVRKTVGDSLGDFRRQQEDQGSRDIRDSRGAPQGRAAYLQRLQTGRRDPSQQGH